MTSRKFAQLGNQSSHRSRNLTPAPHALPDRTGVDSSIDRSLGDMVASGEN